MSWDSGKYSDLPTLHRKIMGTQCPLFLTLNILYKPLMCKKVETWHFRFCFLCCPVWLAPLSGFWYTGLSLGCAEIFDLLRRSLASNEVTSFICNSVVFVKKMHFKNNLISCVCLQATGKNVNMNSI